MSEKRILYLSYDGMTDPLGQSQVLPYLAGLSRKGYRISLVSFEKKDKYRKWDAPIREMCAAENISWYPCRYTKAPLILSTLKDIGIMRKMASRLHKKQPFDLVHCRSYIAAIVGLWLKKRTGVPFIFDMRGFWADERVDGGLWHLSNPVSRWVYLYFKKKEREFLEEASAVVSLTHNAEKELRSWKNGKRQAPVYVIPCCVDMNLFDPGTITPADIAGKKKELMIDDKEMILSYIGSTGTWYLLDEMLLFFKKWRERFPSAVFLFVTPDPPGHIIHRAEKAGLPATALRIVSARRTEIPLYISVCDFSVFFIKPAYSKKASSPTKQAEIMAMGKPVICNAGIGDTDFIVDTCSSGVIVKNFAPAGLERGVAQAADASFDPLNIRKGAENFFSLQKGVRDYEAVYENVLNEKR